MTERTEKKNTKNAQSSSAEELWNRWNSTVDRIFGGITVKERFLALVAIAVTALTAIMLARAPLPFLGSAVSNPISYPLADAFLASSGVYAPVALAALIWHAISTGTAVPLRILLLCGLIFIRTGSCLWLRGNGTRGKLFREAIVMKIGSASAFSLISCTVYAVNNGLTVENLTTALTVLLTCPILTAALCGFFSGCPVTEHGSHKLSERAYYELSMYLLFALCTYAGRGYTFVGCSVSALLAVFLTIAVAHKGGVIRGALCGAALGFIYMPVFALPLAATGLLCGALRSLNSSVSIGISCTVGCVIAVLTRGYSSFQLWIPECIISVAIAAPTVRYNFFPRRFPFPGADGDELDAAAQRELERESAQLGVQKLYSISDAFERLSDGYRDSFDRRTITRTADAAAVCQRLSSGFCDSCPMTPICWESQRKSTEASINAAVKSLYLPKNGVSGAEGVLLPAGFHCIKPDALKSELSSICESEAMLTEETGKKPSESFSEEYECVSAMLRDIAESEEGDRTPDQSASARVRRAAKALAFSPDVISVLGRRKKTVVAYGLDEKRISTDTEKLREAFSKACGATLGMPTFSGEGAGKLTFEGVRRFSAHSAVSERKSPSAEKSGDKAVGFNTASGYFYSVISDGMGSGAEAAECAEIATMLSENLLKCGIRKELAVRMIGSALRRRGSECFATVDMLELDLITGAACSLKNGAACSYIVRDGSVYCISARSIPVGITESSPSEEVKFSLKEGDTVVMMSDGVAQDTEDGAWLIQLIGEKGNAAAQELADEILERAVALRQKAADAPQSENEKSADDAAEEEDSVPLPSESEGIERIELAIPVPDETGEADGAPPHDNTAEAQPNHDDMTVVVIKISVNDRIAS